MRDLDEQLWRLGVPSKTKHNETAPCQHELAPVYETANIACDHNLLTMEVLRVTAKRHGLTCLLHEKPFDGINGSGKHNNFSLSTDDGINFLSPGKHPEENKLFLLTLCTLIEVVDDYADLIRLTAATPGNDARLGGHEAPPPIISIFLGEQLTSILESIAKGVSPDVRKMAEINADIDILPSFQRDDSDRNRTSPFAFTGNKFEFRMLGSSQSIALCNTVIGTAVADVFSRFADRLEAADDLEAETARLIAETIRDHGRVIFNGNNYTTEWLEEAKRRGLPVLSSSLDAFDSIVSPKNTAMLSRGGVLSETECHARHEILLENFVKVISIEAETMLQMTSRQIFPAASKYLSELAGGICSLATAGGESKAMKAEMTQLSELLDLAWARQKDLAAAFHAAPGDNSLPHRAAYVESEIRPRMAALREACDSMEDICDAELWPMPTYTDLLHRV
jgi:glutamine synthetase